jgi:hypothetical protein
MRKPLEAWERVDTIVEWVLIPLAVIAAIAEFAGGEIFHGVLPLVWGFLIFAANREHRAWRRRTHRFNRLELEDRDRFVIAAMIVKSEVVSSLAQTYTELGIRDAKVEFTLRRLYQGIADTQIPDDAPPELHRMKALAARAAEDGGPVTIH